MIVFLDGVLEEKEPARVVVSVGGVGYAAEIPLSTFDRLPSIGDRFRLLTEHIVREDDELLYGFATSEERALFRLLTSVSGIGPKLGLAVLSGITPPDFKAAVAAGDVKRLSSISGVGKKLAERLLVEMKNKLPKDDLFVASLMDGAAGFAGDSRFRDAAQALAALGYKPADAGKMARDAIAKLPADAPLEDILRAALAKGGAR